MNPGFPKRKTIERVWPVTPGGDGRYLWNINRFDKTTSIVDLSTNTTVATLSMPSIVDYSCGNYVPADKCLYIHHSSGHYKVDLDPTSATFATILVSNSDFPTSNSGNIVTYVQSIDAFVGVSNGSTARPRLNPTATYFIGVGGGRNVVGIIAQSLGYQLKGGTNPSNGGSFENINTLKQIGFGSISSHGCPVINKRFILEWAEMDINAKLVRSVNTVGMQGHYMSGFCPRSKRLVGGGGNSSGWRLGVIDHVSFTYIGNTSYIGSTGAPAAYGYQYREVFYNPFNGLMYCKPIYHAANTSDIHVYDCTQALTSMYQYAVAVGNDRVPGIAPYNNCTMGFNFLKNDEYYY